MATEMAQLSRALRAIAKYRTRIALLRALRSGSLEVLAEDVDLGPDVEAEIHNSVRRMWEMGVGVLVYGEPGYPQSLNSLGSPPPFLFYLGNLELLGRPSVGMCGSRNASLEGLAAARACGEVMARQGVAVISGYAKGVDSEAHLAALKSGGDTVIVLAEEILHFRLKGSFREHEDPTRTLVISQFPPKQRWNVGAAMTRNAVIAGLGRALVVIEAGKSGGTLDAGLQALRMELPVLALEFAAGSPPGNEILFARGAYRVASRGSLVRVVETLP